MIADESPLRRLPAALIPGQVMFFNAIRFSVEVLDAAITSLRPELYRLAIEEEEQRAATYPTVMMLAWSVIDSANRLRVLLESMRRLGWIVGGPLFKARLRKLDEARALRDAVQHLDDHIKRALADDLMSPAWGYIAWAALVAGDDGEPTGQAFSCILVPGSVVTTTLPVINPAGRKLRSLVDPIELESFGARVSLSELEATVQKLVSELEENLGEQFAGYDETTGSDLLLKLLFSFGESDDAGSGDDFGVTT